MVQIEIADPELALQVLSALDSIEIDNAPGDVVSHLWLDALTLKIQAALQHQAENTWKHLSSWDLDGVYIEINEFGDVRVEEKVFKPRFDKGYNQWVVTFVTQQGHVNTIDPIHFVKVHFNKDLEL
jgi:hypothetical protein